LSDIVVGQEAVINQLLIALLADGHMLIEGVPGTAKTLLVKTLAALLGVEFGRIQMTPDMLPSDIIGSTIYDMNSKSFVVRKGPVFTNLLLADEINRTPPKTQSALLEAMEERHVTLDGKTENLDEIFMVVATQNPVEFEGTYPLPEAQLDRFMLKVEIGYPGAKFEKAMLENFQSGKLRQRNWDISPVASAEDVIKMKEEFKALKVETAICEYISELVEKTRKRSDISLGASPRAAIAWMLAAKGQAALMQRDFVIPDDVKMVALPVLCHRLLLTPEAELEGVRLNDVIGQILNTVPVPR
jgi:MoxR-like ATPase